MPPKLNGPSHQEFAFVGGPLLKGPTRGIRSSLLRRALSDKRSKNHRDAATRLNLMLRQREGPALCSCPQTLARIVPISNLNSGDADGFRLIQPKANVNHSTNDAQLLHHYCITCGKAATTPGPLIQSLGAGNFDPLVPSNSEFSRFKVHEILNFACNAIWAHFRIVSDFSANCYQSWTFPFEDKLRVYAVLWSTSYHQDMLRLTNSTGDILIDSREQLQLKALTLEALQAEINNISHLTSPDGLVMAILFLAVNDTHRIGVHQDPNPFTPPFTTLHALDIYGSRVYNPSHWSILHHIIERFGGFRSIKAFALAWLLSIADIMNAVHTLQKPIYPMLNVQGEVLDLQPPLALFRPHGWGGAGLGFNELLFLSPPVRQEIITVFIHVGQLSSVIESYSTENLSPAVLDTLGDSRNLVHHRLFSLPDEGNPPETILEYGGQTVEAEAVELSRTIYLTCRLSVILFAIHVTFPIPRSASLRRSLILSLLPKIKWLMDRGASGPLLVWILVTLIIAMADENSSEKLLEDVRRLCLDLQIDTADGLLRLLRSFAWVDSAVGNLWHAICNKIIEIIA